MVRNEEDSRQNGTMLSIQSERRDEISAKFEHTNIREAFSAFCTSDYLAHLVVQSSIGADGDVSFSCVSMIQQDS